MDIIFQDEFILVVNKPAGLVVRSADDSVESVLSQLNNEELHLVHRIDQVASGLLILAKNAEAAALFSDLFKDRKIEKTYLAMVKKDVAKDNDTLEEKLIHKQKSKKAYVNKSGKLASLTYEKIMATNSCDCLKVKIKQGRFHMIRCLLSHHGMPIKGDVKYGARRKNSDRSIDLHAYELRFTHPVTQEIHNIIAPLRANNLWKACADFLAS